jgi:hypothetical protein
LFGGLPLALEHLEQGTREMVKYGGLERERRDREEISRRDIEKRGRKDC